MAETLSKQLSTLGFRGETADFRDMVVELHQVLHPSWSVDELVCHPDYAGRFCAAVRQKACSNTLPDNLILRTLLNCRKSQTSED